MTPDPSIFRAYDIRGVVGQTLDAEVALRLGLALGGRARAEGLSEICVGRDGRLSGPELAGALIEGLSAAGLEVIDLGAVPTPVVYFAAHHRGHGSAVAVTGSHNPPDYNGFKMMLGGRTLFGPEIQAIGQDVAAARYRSAAAPGRARREDLSQAYVDRVAGDVHLSRAPRVAVDCGNGIAGPVARRVLAALGCRTEELFFEVDGRFPNHHPDPSRPDNLKDLAAATRRGGAELGLAFDGDADRLGVITPDGSIIWPDRQLMLFAADVLRRLPGSQIIYDVKCTLLLRDWIRSHGGEPVISRTGHSFVKLKLRETGAPLAGEMSGHLFFNDGRWPGFDDGIYAAARLLEILSREDDPAAVLSALPQSCNTPEIQIVTGEGENHALIERLRRQADFPEAREVILIDGLRVEFDDGFALARASNTTPTIVLRLEGFDEVALARITERFRRFLLRVEPSLELPF